jgi:hypothetical protein
LSIQAKPSQNTPTKKYSITCILYRHLLLLYKNMVLLTSKHSKGLHDIHVSLFYLKNYK